MKEYLKPEIEYVDFKTEEITGPITGVGGTGSNTFTEDDFE